MNTETKNFEAEKKDIFDMAIEIETKAKKYDELKEAMKSIKESLEKCQKIHLQQGTSESEAMASAYSTSIDVINTHTEGLI